MYYDFYGFERPPFNLTPDPQFLFLSGRHKAALASLEYGVASRKGFTVLTGEIGAGKTTLCRTLIRKLGDQTRVALILNSSLSDVELLQAINDEFDVFSDSNSKKELIDALNAYLLMENAAGRDCLLVIDEAQNLHPETLEQVRMLSNLETETDKLIQILLMGQPELRDTLRLPRLEQLNQRITVRHHLEALDREETAAYVGHRIGVATRQDEPARVSFAADALDRLHAFSRGVPRKINLVADRALLAAYVCEARTVPAAIIAQAISEVSGMDADEACAPRPPFHGAAANGHAEARQPAAARAGVAAQGPPPVAIYAQGGGPAYAQPFGAAPWPYPTPAYPQAPPAYAPGYDPYAQARAAQPAARSRGGSSMGTLGAFALTLLVAGALSFGGYQWWKNERSAMSLSAASRRDRETPAPTPRPTPGELASAPTPAAVETTPDVATPEPAAPQPTAAPTATPTPTPTPRPTPRPTPKPTPKPLNWQFDENRIVRVQDPGHAFLAAQLTLATRYFEGITINPEKLGELPAEALKRLQITHIPDLRELGLTGFGDDSPLDALLALNHPFILQTRPVEGSGLAPALLIPPGQSSDADPIRVVDPLRGFARVDRSKLEMARASAFVFFFDAQKLLDVAPGSEGPSVAKLQGLLLRKSAWPIDAKDPDGSYGLDTRHAVALFQESIGLPSTGDLDPRTLFHLLPRPELTTAGQAKQAAEPAQRFIGPPDEEPEAPATALGGDEFASPPPAPIGDDGVASEPADAQGGANSPDGPALLEE
jgi:type II secretory pathway predicted ATPase ExeA